MINLPDEIILEIWAWFFNNKDMIALRRCCKRFKALGDKYGYIKHLNISIDTNYMNLVKIWGKQNLNSIQSIHINEINFPANWIPFQWPSHTTFSQCRMGFFKIFPPLSPTTELRITDYKSKKIQIDWSKLPKLKLLELYVNDIDFTGLENCRELQHLNIQVKTKILLPSWIANLKNLVFLSTNIPPESNMHFISKKLRVCMAPKREKVRILKNGRKNSITENFTAESNIVPWRHLIE
jgi:hypothetical protein